MKRNALVICSSVAALHLMIGGAVILGGCTGVEEDEPMPKGAQIVTPAQKVETPVETEKPFEQQPEFVPEKTEEPAEVFPEPKVEAPVPEKGIPEKGAPELVPVKGESQAAAVPNRAEDVTYVIKKGDSYWKIAKMFGISAAELAAYNNIAPEKLYPGQKIQIPATGKKITVPAATAPSRTKAVVSAKKAIPANGIYTVQKGDSFYKIAQKFGLRAADIAAYNSIPLTKSLQVGQKLKLPAKGEKAAAPATKASAAPKAEAPADDLAPIAAPEDNAEVPAINPEAPAVNPEEPVAEPAVKVTTPEVPAVEGEDLPAAEGASTFKIDRDQTIKEICDGFGISEQKMRELNPKLPADGIVKAGTTIRL